MNLREVMARGDPDFPGGEAERRGWYAGYDAAVAEARASADPTSVAGEQVKGWRQREVQMIGAAISTRNWHDLETAYNQLRDNIDRALSEEAWRVRREALATNAPDAAKREGEA